MAEVTMDPVTLRYVGPRINNLTMVQEPSVSSLTVIDELSNDELEDTIARLSAELTRRKEEDRANLGR